MILELIFKGLEIYDNLSNHGSIYNPDRKNIIKNIDTRYIFSAKIDMNGYIDRLNISKVDKKILMSILKNDKRTIEDIEMYFNILLVNYDSSVKFKIVIRHSLQLFDKLLNSEMFINNRFIDIRKDTSDSEIFEIVDSYLSSMSV